MKLISMTDFVISQWDKDITREEFAQSMINYATFLKQPLKLWMFVPCDENGNVLEEPKGKVFSRENGAYEFDEYCKIYEKTKEKVLFEGFEVENDLLITPTFGKQEIKNIKGLTIEALTGFEIELTPTALKQIQP